jgi:hypothetical protein
MAARWRDRTLICEHCELRLLKTNRSRFHDDYTYKVFQMVSKNVYYVCDILKTINELWLVVKVTCLVLLCPSLPLLFYDLAFVSDPDPH